MTKYYMLTYKKPVKDNKIMNIYKIPQQHRKYIEVQEYIGTKEQQDIKKYVANKIVNKKPRWYK